ENLRAERFCSIGITITNEPRAFAIQRASAPFVCSAALLGGSRWRGTPYLKGNVSNGLGERPPVPPKVLHCVLPLSEGHVRRRLQDARTTPLSLREMLVNVLNMYGHVLAHLVGARRPKLGTLAAQHDRALTNVELRMGDAATRSPSA